MQRVSVGRGGDFATIGAALSAADPARPLTLVLAAQVFEEKVFCEHPAVRVIGQGMDQTVIRWHDGGFHPHPDGRKTGTFRSYTACFDGKLLCMENLTVENTAGRGEQHGQAIALAVYSETAYLKNVRLKSYQDTLFMGPLPDKERQPDGFLGPRRLPRACRRASTMRRVRFWAMSILFSAGRTRCFRAAKFMPSAKEAALPPHPVGRQTGLAWYLNDVCFLPTSRVLCGWRARGEVRERRPFYSVKQAMRWPRLPLTLGRNKRRPIHSFSIQPRKRRRFAKR